MHSKNTFMTRLENYTPVDDKKEVLRYIIFLGENRKGTIKVQICSDCITQYDQDDRLYTNSNIVFQYSVIIMEAIEVHKKLHLEVIDLTGEFYT